MSMDDMRIAKKLTRGVPQATPENLICIYGESGSGKTTEVMKYLAMSGKSAIYLDFDGNSAPVINAPKEVLDKMNYIKLRNSLSKIHTADFVNDAMLLPLVDVCPTHGYMSCGICRSAQQDTITVNFDTWKDYDLVIVDSVTILINAIKLFSVKEHEESGSNNPMQIWQRVSLLSNTMMHFLRECHQTVIVLSHPQDIRHQFQKAVQKKNHPTRAGLELVDAYYRPCFGSVPFTREAAKNLSAVIYQQEDGSILTNNKAPYFANARREIKSNTVSGALQEILG